MQRFWATDGHRKCTVSLLYSSWHYHIYIFKSLAETNVLACKMFTSGCRLWLKNVTCLSSLMIVNYTPCQCSSHSFRTKKSLLSSVENLINKLTHLMYWSWRHQRFDGSCKHLSRSRYKTRMADSLVIGHVSQKSTSASNIWNYYEQSLLMSSTAITYTCN